jgi:hypothetical protein
MVFLAYQKGESFMNRGGLLVRIWLILLITITALSTSLSAYSYFYFKLERGEDYGHDHIKMIVSELMRQEYHLPIYKGNVFFLTSDSEDSRLQYLLSDLYEGNIDSINSHSSHEGPRIVGLMLKDNFSDSNKYYLVTKDEYIVIANLKKILVFNQIHNKTLMKFFPSSIIESVSFTYLYRIFDFRNVYGVIWL